MISFFLKIFRALIYISHLFRNFAVRKGARGVMAAAPDLGSGGVIRGGSSPPVRTTLNL